MKVLAITITTFGLIACNPQSEKPPAISSQGQLGGVTANSVGTVNQQIVPLIHPEPKTIMRIAQLIADGAVVQRAFLTSDDSGAIATAENEWVGRCIDFLSTIDPSYAVQFMQAHATASMGLPSGHSAVGGGVYMDIEAKRDALAAVLTELRHAR